MASNNHPYQPPFTLTPAIVNLVSEISEGIGRLSAEPSSPLELRLRRINRIRSIQSSLAIEGNTLTEEQITALLEGKRVLAPPREIQEARNAIAAYDSLPRWKPGAPDDLLDAHGMLMHGLLQEAGAYRRRRVGVMAGDRVIHMAPPAKQVPGLMYALHEWVRICGHHPLVVGSVFHYEFEFIHPFADGNGRVGRLWQTLLLSHWNPLFAHIPVESLVYAHQEEYYQALHDSTTAADSAPFIEFILRMILDAVSAALTPQVAPHVTPQVVALLHVLVRDMTRAELQAALALQDRKSFRERYLAPALQAGWIEMTRPEKPQSRLQKYRLTPSGRRWLDEQGDARP